MINYHKYSKASTKIDQELVENVHYNCQPGTDSRIFLVISSHTKNDFTTTYHSMKTIFMRVLWEMR